MTKIGLITILLYSSLFGPSQLTSEDVFILGFFEKEATLDGFIDIGEWPIVDSITGFISPWDLGGNDQTIFKAYYTNSYLFFYPDLVKDTMLFAGIWAIGF